MVCYNPNVNSVEYFSVDFIYFYVLSARFSNGFVLANRKDFTLYAIVIGRLR